MSGHRLYADMFLDGSHQVMPDPGNAGTITPDRNPCTVELVTTGAETRALADPKFSGQQLVLVFKTDGGDCVITGASPVNQTGNNTMTAADAGDVITFVGVNDNGDLEWRIIGNDGVALSTV